MVALFSVIVLIFLSLLITKIASAALINTGLSKHTAKFQARSAFTGVGFTTQESERITQHPARRKIISTLMLLGNAGIVTVMVSLILTFVNHDEKGLPLYYNLIILVGSVIVLAIFASSEKVDAWFTKVANKVLGKFTSLKVRDYDSLFKLSGDYHVAELHVRRSSWVEGRKLADCSLGKEGVTLLGIERKDGTYDGAPGDDSVINAKDTLILYGREEAISKLDERKREKS